jgi:C-terminal processing protease CtpA/Prc
MKTLVSILIFLLVSVSTYSQTTIQESQKIATFCKLWGFLKYYHPTVAKGKLDWDREFMSRIKVVSSLNSKQEINNYYSEWIKSLGKVKNCKKCKNDLPDSLKFNLDLAWLSDSSVFTNDLINQLQFIQNNRNQGKNYYVQQYRFVGNTKYDNEKTYKDSIFPSMELRLLGLSRYWNIINYFFPYKYRIGQDWNNVLVEMIPKFRDSKDTISYHLVMLELTAKINDSHSAFFATKFTNQYFGLKWAPFSFKIIDNKAIVTGFYNDSLCQKNDIQIGDVFLKVDNLTIADIINEKSKYIGASNESVKFRNMYYAIFNGQTDSVNTTFERYGIIEEKIIYRFEFNNFKYNWTHNTVKDTCKILDGNIGYLNLGLLQPKQTDKYLNKLKDTRALIIDVRNYPNGTMYKIASFLNEDSKPFAKFTNPDLSFPGIFHYTKPYTCGIKNKSPYFGKVVLLFNETSQSHAEFTLMALQTAPNVISIGSQTAGADGNVSLITFPGNYKTYMTGIGVYYPDGRETQRIGIIPDIEVKPTIEGLKAGRDEVLEKAIAVINGE